MAVSGKAQAVLVRINDALDLLDQQPLSILPIQSRNTEVTEALPSLLEMCEYLLADEDRPPPLRVIHHFACTGGTIISRAIAALPNVQLLSEIDPLSTLLVNRAKPLFLPTDLINGLRHAVRNVDETLLIDMFLASLEVLQTQCAMQGMMLVLRDHSHSRYCTSRDPASRPGLAEIVAGRYEVLSAVTVRHPLDSFVSVASHNWHKHMDVPTLEEYARRYHLFLDDHGGLPSYRYEDFVQDPERILSQLCAVLELDFSPDVLLLLSEIHLSGDSGRKGNRVAIRPSRPVPDWIAEEAKSSEAYARLCTRMGYEARFEIS